MKYRNNVKYFSLNGELKKIEEFPVEVVKASGLVYEVIKVVCGELFLIDEHIERLGNSLEISNHINVSIAELKSYSQELISANEIHNGNLKIVCKIIDNKANWFLFFIPHRYPSDEQYSEGVKLISQKAERPNPNAKIANWNIRGEANKIIDKNNIYETLLINSDNEVTEGSRSNIFFIKGNVFYTADEEFVLAGITRTNIINIIYDLGYQIEFICIPIIEINNYDACFISGTSPGVLQVKRINDIIFEINNKVYNKLFDAYNKIDKY